MKVRIIAALLAAVGLSSTAGQAWAEDDKPAGFISPGTATLISLGKAGLLYPMFNDDLYGVIQARANTNRATIGAAGAPFAPQTGYKDEDFALILPLQGIYELPQILDSGTLFLYGSAVHIPINADPNLIELDGDVTRFDAQVWYSPSPKTLLTLGVERDYVNLDIVNAGPGFYVERESWGIRSDVLHRFNQNLGIVGRMEYQFGDLTTRTPGPPPTFFSLHEQGDNRFYTQWEAVGNFTSKDIDFIPPEWAFQPALGGAYNISFLESTPDSNGDVSASVNGGETEQYAAAYGRLRVERQAFAPGSLNPSFGIGFTHELVSELDRLSRDRTYVDVMAGLGVILPYDGRLDFEYIFRQGTKGVRQNQSLTAVLTFKF